MKKQFTDSHVPPLGHILSDSEPTSLYAFSLLLHA